MSGPTTIICTSATDWSGYAQAAAIFVTGLLAVGAALWVGKRQTAIQKRQADIVAEQAATEARLRETEIRASLLSRRYDFIRELSNELYSSSWDHQRATAFDQVFRTIDMAEIIFPDNQIMKVMDIANKIIELNLLKRTVETATGPEGADNFQSRLQQIKALEDQITKDLPDALKQLKCQAQVTI